MIRPFYVAALVLGPLLIATTARAGSHDECLRRLGLSYGAGYHGTAPGPTTGCNHFHWKSICAWPGGATLGGRCGCECGPPCATPCCEPCAAPGFAPRLRMPPCGPCGIGGRPPAGVY